MQAAVQEQFREDTAPADEELSIENIVKAVKRLETKGAGSRISDNAWAES